MISDFTVKPGQLRPTGRVRERAEFLFLCAKELLSDAFLFFCSPQSRNFSSARSSLLLFDLSNQPYPPRTRIFHIFGDVLSTRTQRETRVFYYFVTLHVLLICLG